MAKRDRALENEIEPIVDAEDSLLIRSAESLGRVIGSLQRELDNAARHLFRADSASRRNGTGKARAALNGKNVRKRTTKSAAAATPTRVARLPVTAKKKTGARKAASRKKNSR